MRLFVLAFVLTLSPPAMALAQRADAPPRFTIAPRSGPASQGWPHDPVPRFTIPPRGTIGLPQIGLPLPTHGLQPLPEHQRRDRGQPRDHGRRRHGRVAFPVFVYATPYYAPIFAEPAPIEIEPEPAASTGRLILEAMPAGAQVFVDGYYAGVPEDFSSVRGGGVLEAGIHRLDVSAPGYEPAVLDLRIAPNQTVTYRGTLKPVMKSSEAPKIDKPETPTTFYLIPGCYMGNVHPRDARLPATCDVGRVVEFQY